MADKTAKHETAGRPPRARKPRKQADLRRGSGESTESSGPEPGATGREMAVEGRNGGTLIRHPPGSNGDTHRGPDRTLRTNAMRSLILQALAGAQTRLVKVEGRKNRVTVEVPMAMCDDIIAGLQLVARE